MVIQNRYVKPHRVLSREVCESDIQHICSEAVIMHQLCYEKHGVNESAYAIAHPQIEDVQPLRFFVDKENRIIINPKIIEASIDEEKFEGCMSFPEGKSVKVQRFKKIRVQYQTIENNTLSGIKTANYSNIRAEIFQHEIDHFNGKYIYDESTRAI